jgi:hypothetical protein
MPYVGDIQSKHATFLGEGRKKKKKEKKKKKKEKNCLKSLPENNVPGEFVTNSVK